MSANRILGLVLLAVGVALLIFAFNSTGKLTEKVSEGVTGQYTDTTMWYIVGGIASAVAGSALVTFGGGRGPRQA